MFSTIVHIYRTEGGIPALYRGLVPTVMGVAPYVGLNFAVYEHMRKLVTPEGRSNPTGWGKLLAGAISGAVAQSITYPMDVLRRRFQVQTSPVPSMLGKYPSFGHSLLVVWVSWL